MASNFRDKEAFIIVYNMSSMLELSNLEAWFNKCFDSCTNRFSIVIAVGNSTDLTEEQLLEVKQV